MSTEPVDSQPITAPTSTFRRLLRVVKLACEPRHILCSFLAIICIYVLGRAMDAAWLLAGCGVVVSPDSPPNEIIAYAELDAETHRAYCQMEGDAPPSPEPMSDEELDRARRIIEDRLAGGLAAIDGRSLERDEARRQRRALRRAADVANFLLHGKDPSHYFSPDEIESAPGLLGRADPTMAPDKIDNDLRVLNSALSRARTRVAAQSAGRAGVFDTWLEYHLHCLAAAVRGAAAGRWGLSGSAFSAEPSLLGSLASGTAGCAWLVTQRPFYALLFGIGSLAALALFGGAIARSAAVLATRGEHVSFTDSLAFAREKFGSYMFSAITPLLIALVVAIVMWLGAAALSVVSLIPAVGGVADGLAGVLFVFALLGGLALAVLVFAWALGFPLMWATIATEASDSLDAVTHAFTYVGQRLLNLAVYAFGLLLLGAFWFIVFRAVTLLLLKSTHVVVGSGLSLFGLVNGDYTYSLSKLDAMWHMPAMADLAFLPQPGAPLWGAFGEAPLGWGETLGAVGIAIWVFSAVGILGAFLVSYYFCGSAEVYLLLRRDVDGTEVTEVFYEEDSPLGGDAPAAESQPPRGTSLPVVGTAPSPEPPRTEPSA